ncbi:hypothetical protein K7472_18865 [Streptomyces sp. PTM05]|uniref:Uncharacterized protein n=1 Tax=Streptantibioticus parmotrematis TaxID=2873249 RepID=A0ABS7QX13_9ACTN|nr:hypothetical protein [Streptantibioticus parmotrematis]MBY8886905.1 hypothetical protein [Streptantibioticus parmotrematis]
MRRDRDEFDGLIGHLLSTLAVLRGTEALLSVMEDTREQEYLLALVGRHAEDASATARLLLARMQAGRGGEEWWRT